MKFSAVRNIMIATGGVFVFVFLFIKALGINLDQHAYYISNLRQINKLNSQINEDVLQASEGQLSEYDSLLRALQDLQQLQSNLKEIPYFINRRGHEEIAQNLQAYIKLSQAREKLIREFKSHNKILKKSLNDFPITVSDLLVTASTELGDYELVLELNDLLKNVLKYNQSPKNQYLTHRINQQIEKLRQRQAQVYPEVDLERAIAYAEIVLQNKPLVDDLAKQIAELPASQRSEKISQTYNVFYQQALEKSKFYRFLLYLCTLILVISFSIYIIIKLKKSAALIQQVEEKYRRIVDNSVEGIFQTTPSGRYMSANITLANIYGYASPAELCASLTNIDRQLYVQPKRHSELIELLEKHDSVSDFESQVYRKDGSRLWIAQKARAVRDRHGDLIYYEGTVEDITVRKAWLEALHSEQEQSERLLLNILPKPIAQRLKQSEKTIADSFEEVTVLFADIVGFTELATYFSATQVVDLLNQIFSAFDELSERYGLEKIKTIGDAYMVVGGLPTPQENHTEAIAKMALDMQEIVAQFNIENNLSLSIRMGINIGPVVAGVIGIKKFSYDLWGDTVNMASRMESHGVANRIQVTEKTYKRLKDRYLFEERGVIQVKGKGRMTTYFLKGKKQNDQKDDQRKEAV
ncbi:MULTISPECIES: adenylate/guanylate cyclase domain-containing protein [unclassified Coleofasciculus]|uniref:adenylate/guanylate cyclase domain-containing protein n=1 Tax=unclassified Coleofasciculus TaxID=2692782 RepID=UPI0018829E2C|nr:MULTISPECIES: adenylate/guanylate cyclase domain-containing protein [unclassified Coleofasciculus]MBE9125044.1 PAS domain S-box protein [Coleofasciculus sp. LEGE 07081]MBE9147636.1 PAS domain S-box protein [Coleofasciculus sp. LEGE 07092]